MPTARTRQAGCGRLGALVLAITLVLVASGAPAADAAGTSGAGRLAVTADAPPPSETTVATTAGVDDGLGGLEPASDTPSPRGTPAPPTAQRVADTLIFVGLLVALVAGVVVALWSARRARSR